MAPAAEKSAQPYRRHIVGLPLQRSLFGEAARAAPTIGLPALMSELDFPARLDENGHLFLDRSKVAALTKALLSWFTPATLNLMRRTHAAACDLLLDVTENAARAAAALDAASCRKLSEDLANRMALVLAYGVLSKFVPDVLLRALVDAGDVEPPPFPKTSAGADLVQNTFALYEACCAFNYTPQRLQHEWPRVLPEVFSLVGEFCKRQTGFGPLAWDSPGYENPSYVVRLLHSAFDKISVERIRGRLSFAKRSVVAGSLSCVPERIAALRDVLGFWLDFLERETWYVRRAFYFGMIPVLKRLATECRRENPNLQLADLLFLEVGELIAGAVDPAVIQKRRHRYMENSEYLSLHGIAPGHLTTMLESL
jgi:hypothetical protein